MEEEKKRKEDDKDKKAASDGGVYANTLERVNRYGSANHEYVKAYTGYAWENKKTGQSGFAKGHKQVAESKVNSQFKQQNLKQQSGFNAEIDYTAKKNADSIIKNSSTRYSRSNDVGRGNDMQVDVGAVGTDGDFIRGSDGRIKNGVQLKFSGTAHTPAELQKIARTNVNRMRPNGKWGRYDSIAVPSEQYGPMREYAKAQSIHAKSMADKLRKNGNLKEAQKWDQVAEEYGDCFKRIKDTGITSEDALFARNHPKLHTARRIGQVSHQAGMDQLASSALISGSISAAKGIAAVARGEKDISEVVTDITVDSASGAAKGYATTFAGSTLKGFMMNSNHNMVRALSHTSAPALIITSVAGVAGAFRRYLSGEINELELAENLGANGVGIVASTWGASLGTMVFPGIGTIVGGMVGSAVSSVIYEGAMKVLREERESTTRRTQVQLWAKEAKRQMESNRRVMETNLRSLHLYREQSFSEGLSLLHEGDRKDDILLYMQGINQVIRAAGGEPLPFSNMKDLSAFMQDRTQKLVF